MISRASAPGKVILAGEHFVVYGGTAILRAIDKRVSVLAEDIDEEKIVIESEIGSLELQLGDEVPSGSPLLPMYHIAAKLLRGQSTIRGIKIEIQSDIPSGVGLGSSSACCVACAAAVLGLFSREDRDEILDLAIEAEKTTYKDSSGADCTVCAHGGTMLYGPSGFERVCSGEVFGLVIADSGVPHSTSEMVSKVRRYKERDEQRFAKLCHAEEKLVQDVLGLLEKGDAAGIGAKLQENQILLEQIGVSSERLKEMTGIADKVSFGSKVTGAGGGGCIIAACDCWNQDQTIEALKEHGYDCFAAYMDTSGLEQGESWNWCGTFRCLEDADDGT